MVVFDGANRRIVLSGTTNFSALDIYAAAKNWDSLQANMQYPCPMDAVGKAVIGSGAYTDAVIRLTNGWKLQPQGYAQGTQLVVNGTLVTADGTSRTVAPSAGSEVTWLFQVASAATIVETSGGSGSGDNGFANPMSELLPGELPANPTPEQALMLLYAMARNRMTTTATEVTVHNANNEPIAKAPVSDDGATFTREPLQAP